MPDTAVPSPGSPEPLPSGEPVIAPRSDLKDGVAWVALGVAVVIGSITMDRLERQNINPYTVPGLLPGLLGIAMILLGSILALRSWRRGALHMPVPALTLDEREQRPRIWIVVALCMTYGVVLVGHGIAFWLASTVFVSGSILLLQRLSRDAVERVLTAKVLAKALLIGLGAGGITHLVFQELFLVRLP
jgi:hypothetical protein